MRNTFKKFMPIAVFALVLVFAFAKPSFAAESFTDFSLSSDDGVKASYDDDANLLTISGSGKIEYDKWVEMAQKFDSKQYTKTHNGWSNYPKSYDDFDMLFIADEDKKIKLCNTGEFGGLFQEFKGNIDFNNSIDISEVTNMRRMFCLARKFTSDLSGWDVSHVTDMTSMFSFAEKFTSDLSGWDVSNVTNMGSMFQNVYEFNADLSGWDVSHVTDMSSMFANAKEFTSDLSGWDVSNVTDMSGMFNGAEKFASDLSGWDVSNVTEFNSMFWGDKMIEFDITKWDTSNGTLFGALLMDTNFDFDISKLDTNNATDIMGMCAFSKVSRIDLLNRENAKYNAGSYYFLDHVSADFIGFTKLKSFYWDRNKYNPNEEFRYKEYWISENDGEFVK